MNACATADIGDKVLICSCNASQATVLVGFAHELPEFCIGHSDRRGHLRVYLVVLPARETVDQCAEQVEDDSSIAAFLLSRSGLAFYEVKKSKTLLRFDVLAL